MRSRRSSPQHTHTPASCRHSASAHRDGGSRAGEQEAGVLGGWWRRAAGGQPALPGAASRPLMRSHLTWGQRRRSNLSNWSGGYCSACAISTMRSAGAQVLSGTAGDGGCRGQQLRLAGWLAAAAWGSPAQAHRLQRRTSCSACQPPNIIRPPARKLKVTTASPAGGGRGQSTRGRGQSDARRLEQQHRRRRRSAAAASSALGARERVLRLRPEALTVLHGAHGRAVLAHNHPGVDILVCRSRRGKRSNAEACGAGGSKHAAGAAAHARSGERRAAVRRAACGSTPSST